jgi:predicted nucleotidyltransferase
MRKMFKNIIRKLYGKFCSGEQDFFELKKKELTESDKKQIYLESELMLNTGVLQRIVDQIVAKSEVRQLYEWKDQKFCEFERAKREGIAMLMEQIQIFANKVKKEEKSFDKHEIL